MRGIAVQGTLVRFATLVALFVLALPSPSRAMDIDELLSAPIPDAPVSASAAPIIAWVAKERGVRNVYTARAPAFTPRRLTAYDRDDGQAIGGLRLSADGRSLLYVRGGPPDASGQPNNPDGNPDGQEQAVWLVATDGQGAPQRIEAGRAAQFAPGDAAVIVQGRGTFGCHALPGSAAPAWCRAPMLKLKGSNTAQEFSPDGKRLAFVSDRGDHAFVGVLELGPRRVRWIDPDFARDTSPVWSADGRLAWVRMGALRPDEKFRLDAAEPFEVRVARFEGDSIVAAPAHRSSARAGGYAQFGVAQPLQWRGQSLAFASEADGWLRWYAQPLPSDAHAPIGGDDLQPLTPPRCETDSFVVDRQAGVVFSGNCDGLQWRDVYAIGAAGAPRRLTSGAQIATDPVPVAGGKWVAFRHADARLPTAIAVVPRQGGTPRRIHPATLPASFPLQSLVEPRTVRLRASDGMETTAQLFEPRGPARGKRAALVYVHGGPIRQILPGWHPMDYYFHDYAAQQWFADQGFVVLAVNFRAGSGHGQDFRRAPGQGPRGASEYQDVLAAHAYLAAMPQVDRARIGIYGGSYGGYLTSLALARNSDLFAAGVDRHGVHDWRESAKGGDNSGLWGLRPEELAVAGESSPVTALSGWRSPVLVIHGDDDPAVLFAQSTNLVTALRRQQVPVETLVLPGEHHFFLRHDSWLQVHRRTLSFFRAHLQPE